MLFRSHQIFQSKESSVLALTGNIARTAANVDPALAVALICEIDLKFAESAIHSLFMWLSHSDTIPASALRENHVRLLTRKLAKLQRLDDYWVRAFLKRAMNLVPDAVLRLIMVRIRAARRCKDWSYRAIEREYLNQEAEAKSNGLGLLEQPGGAGRLCLLLDNALKSVISGQGNTEIGEVIVALCGRFDIRLLDTLLEWMTPGAIAHVEVVAAVLRCAQSTLLYDFPQFIRDSFEIAELVGEVATSKIQSALIGSTLSGARSTSVGEPFPEDVRLRDYAQRMLAGLSRTDPAHAMFAVLLRAAEQGIERRRRESEAMNAQDEE